MLACDFLRLLPLSNAPQNYGMSKSKPLYNAVSVFRLQTATNYYDICVDMGLIV